MQTGAASKHNHVSFQWITGSFSKQATEGVEKVLVSMYIDGEAAPSLTFFPYEFTGGSGLDSYNRTLAIPATTWTADLWGRNSATSWTNSFLIPFGTSLRITLKYVGTVDPGAYVYYQAHGVLDAHAASFGKVPLPATARLVVQRQALTLPGLGYLNVSQFSRGQAGLVAALALAFVAPNLNTLEGCFHFFPTAATPYPGQLHSTGTEDEFLSSYYFDLGLFASRSAGLLYKAAGDLPHGGTSASAAMWRTYQDDPMLFSDGGAFTWRNGDTVEAATGIKCILREGGTPVGSPQLADVTALTWNYVW